MATRNRIIRVSRFKISPSSAFDHTSVQTRSRRSLKKLNILLRGYAHTCSRGPSARALLASHPCLAERTYATRSCTRAPGESQEKGVEKRHAGKKGKKLRAKFAEVRYAKRCLGCGARPFRARRKDPLLSVIAVPPGRHRREDCTRAAQRARRLLNHRGVVPAESDARLFLKWNGVGWEFVDGRCLDNESA